MRQNRNDYRTLLGLLCALVSVHTASADDGRRKLYDQTVHATVEIRRGQTRGTGWIIDTDRRLVVTNAHVVGTEDWVKIVFPRYENGALLSNRDDYKDVTPVAGEVIDADTKVDLAIVQVKSLPAGTRSLPLAKQSASPGESILSIGNPGASDGMWVAGTGSVRQVYRKYWVSNSDGRFVPHYAYVQESQSAVNAGDSGGPVVNDQGEVVGVVSARRLIDPGTAGQVVAMDIDIDVREIRTFFAQALRLLNPATAADHALRAERLLARNHHSRAAQILDKAISQNPKGADLFRVRGELAYVKKDLPTALASLNRAVELDDKSFLNYFWRGVVHSASGSAQAEKAATDYTKALGLNPIYAPAYNNRSMAYKALGKKDLAQGDIEQALKHDSKLVQAYDNRAQLREEAKEYKQALNDRLEAYRLEPSAFRATAVAFNCNKLGAYSQAVGYCDLGLRHLDPNFAFAWRERGLALEQLHRYPEAILSYSEALKREPILWTYFRRATTYEQLEDARAADDWEKVLQLDPKAAPNLKTFSRCFVQIQNPTQETMTVHLFYETPSTDGEWTWFPVAHAESKPVTVQIGPGKTEAIFDGDFRIKARRIRVWAEGSAGGIDRRYRDEDFWLCREPYQAHKELVRTFVLGIR